MIANAAIVCLQGTVLASGLTVVEQVFGWLLAAWSASILVQSGHHAAAVAPHRIDTGRGLERLACYW